MTDGGKGSKRRNEDVSKVKSNWDLIDWSKKQTHRIDMRDNGDDVEEDYEEELCVLCNGTGEGTYDGSRCHRCNCTGLEPRDFNDVDI
jgi:hypothetical protein